MHTMNLGPYDHFACVPTLGFSLPAVTEHVKQTKIYWVVFRNMSVVMTAALISINTH